MKRTRFYFPRCHPFCRSLEVRRSHCRGSLKMIVLPFLLLRSFRCEGCAKRRHNLFFTRAHHEPKTIFAMMLEERIIPLNLGLQMGMRCGRLVSDSQPKLRRMLTWH